MDPVKILQQVYQPDTTLYQTLVSHSRIVAEKSLAIARTLDHVELDLEFIRNAAMLHDIGIFLTRAASIGCTGEHPYVCHGFLGRELLDNLGLPPAYGLVCERHTGAGITRENILNNQLPLPARDMVPVSLEEKIICVADKYHSKNPQKKNLAITTPMIVSELAAISPDHAQRFSAWAREFNL